MNTTLIQWRLLTLLCALGLLACHPRGFTTETTESAVAVVAAPTTLYLVRHAEKEVGPGADPNNPPLTAIGRARAEQLAQVLTKVDLAAVYSTPYRRAINTAAPTAREQGLSVIEYDPKLDLRRLADSLTQLHAGRAILIVGHSNTVPGILNALSQSSDYPDLQEGDHDGVYRAVVVAHSAGFPTTSSGQAGQAQGAAYIDELRVPLCR